MSGRAAQLEYGYGTACHLPARGRYAGGHCDHQPWFALFKFAHLGNDPFNALNIRSAELAGLPLGVQNLIYNAVFFTMQMIWGRRYVGFGTVANAVCCGFIITFFYDFLTAHFAQAATLPAQLPWVAAAVVCTSLGISLHQTSDLGVAPYDYLALGLRDHTPLPYFCCRLFTDTLCALLAFLLGGLLGPGTLICAFCLGPLIQFFNTHVSENVLQYVPTGRQA